MRGVFGLYGHNLPRIDPGSRSVPAAKINVLGESLERVRPVTGSGTGLAISQLPGGMAVRVVGARVLVKAITGGGGIPAGTGGGLTPGTADVTLCEWNGTALSAGTVVETAYNFTASAVGGSKPITLGWLAQWSIYEVILEPCS